MLFRSHRGILSPLGGWGVSIFLILSGYLSAKFELFKGKLSFINLIKLSFNKLKSRFKRVYALHFFTLLLALPFGYKALFVDFKLGSYCSLFTNILLVQSWFPIGYFGYNSVSWYLSVFMFLSFVGIPLCYLYYTKENVRRKSIYICSILIVFQFVLCQIFK